MKAALSLLILVLSSSAVAQNWKEINTRSIERYKAGDFAEAIRLADRALIKAEAEFGLISNEYLSTLTNKAYAQADSGDELKALANYKTAANLSFGLYSLPHVSQIQSLSELCKSFMSLAAYDSTEHYLNIARYVYISIPKRNKAHYDTSSLELTEAYLAINNLDASLKHKKGQVAAAITLLENQLKMFTEVYSDYEQHGDYQTTLSNLATYYNEVGDLTSASRYAKEYYNIVSKAGRDRDMIYALQNLGSIHRNQSQNDSALFYWNKALTIANSSNYKNSYIHTVILNNIGELMTDQERYDEAITALQTSLSIQTHKEAIQPYLHRTTLYNLAEGYQWSGQYAKADSVYNQLIDILLNDIHHNFTYLSDNEKISFYNTQQLILDSYRSFALNISGVIPIQGSDNPYINPAIPGKLYDLQLNTKAIILNASKRTRTAILASGDTTLVAVYNLWEEKKNQLAQALLNENADAQLIKSLRERIEENEKWLTINSRAFQKGFQMEDVSWKDVQKQLKPGEAAVELVKLVDGLLYGALILTPETKTQPVFSLVMSTRSKHLDKQFFQNYYNSITLQLQDTLSYNTYWQPISDSIRSHMPAHAMPSRVYISSDGIYNQINLNTLWNAATGKYVIDETEIILVTNTKELLSHKENQPSTRKAALFGQPTFSAEGNGRFADLPGTGKEVMLVNDAMKKARWETQVYLREKATESNLKQLKNPRVLHLASHGYFSAADDQNSFADLMISSGIALAGVDDENQTNEDGLLTAFEVTNLDLDGTELVVLSACETGKGAVTAGEGVYGLQRAIRVAGANNVLMSLWKVDDVATQKLMTEFYKRWLKNKNMREAFHSAQQTIRKEYPQPFYWGAFVLAGN
ncbi:MAG: CHAT domain-containing tetratricopeptide repeat protein [Cyclobacteriaceae bacterium]